MPADLLTELEGLRTQAGITYPELQHLELDGSNDVYPSDVEAEANDWFQKVYHEKLNIDEFVAMLKGWQVYLDCQPHATAAELVLQVPGWLRCTGLLMLVDLIQGIITETGASFQRRTVSSV